MYRARTEQDLKEAWEDWGRLRHESRGEPEPRTTAGVARSNEEPWAGERPPARTASGPPPGPSLTMCVAMPLRNRVTPFGDIIATEARGLLFGNRGVLHDEHGRLVRAWQVRRWIACRPDFKGRRRELLRPGRFTELFFLDEATALAAGHRPCAECRREDFVRFSHAWAEVHGGDPPRVDAIDRTLHAERITPGGGKRLHRSRLADLPNGSMVAEDDRAWVVLGGDLLAWSSFGYDSRRAMPGSSTVRALTPPSAIGVLRAGYEPAIHPTARGA
jgi:hypothetical protein